MRGREVERPRFGSREWVSTFITCIGAQIKPEYWCISRVAEWREISINCKNCSQFM